MNNIESLNDIFTNKIKELKELAVETENKKRADFYKKKHLEKLQKTHTRIYINRNTYNNLKNELLTSGLSTISEFIDQLLASRACTR